MNFKTTISAQEARDMYALFYCLGDLTELEEILYDLMTFAISSELSDNWGYHKRADMLSFYREISTYLKNFDNFFSQMKQRPVVDDEFMSSSISGGFPYTKHSNT